jgi:hypothetical protein
MGDRSLRRGMDRAEDALAWLLITVGLLALLAAVLVGMSVYSQGSERVRSEQNERVRATAVLLADARDLPVEHGSSISFVQAPARWADVDGAQHEGDVIVRAGTVAGTEVPIWIDRRGEQAVAPANGVSAVLDGAAVGVAVLGLCGSVIAGAWTGVRRMIFAHNARAWEREWAQVGPEWSSQRPT